MSTIITNDSIINDTAAGAIQVEPWMVEMAAESVIDHHRFESNADRILARYEDDVPALMPSADELSEMGIDVVGLAKALTAGLNARHFGIALAADMLVIDSLNSELAAGIDVAVYNECLEHMVDIVAEREAHPDPVDRILCRHGECLN